jgi:S1-C subfamily serine protease
MRSVTNDNRIWTGRIQTNRGKIYPFEAVLRSAEGYQVRRVWGFDALRVGDIVRGVDGASLATNREMFFSPRPNFTGSTQVLEILRGTETLSVRCPVFPYAFGTILRTSRMDLRSLLGIEYADARLPFGVLVTGVSADGLAGKMGVRKGDVLFQVNRVPLDDAASLDCLARLRTLSPSLEIDLVRNGVSIRLSGMLRNTGE